MRLNPHAREFVPGVSPQSCWSAQDAEDAGEVGSRRGEGV